jgi:hypothetical protein
VAQGQFFNASVCFGERREGTRHMFLMQSLASSMLSDDRYGGQEIARFMILERTTWFHVQFNARNGQREPSASAVAQARRTLTTQLSVYSTSCQANGNNILCICVSPELCGRTRVSQTAFLLTVTLSTAQHGKGPRPGTGSSRQIWLNPWTVHDYFHESEYYYALHYPVWRISCPIVRL